MDFNGEADTEVDQKTVRTTRLANINDNDKGLKERLDIGDCLSNITSSG